MANPQPDKFTKISNELYEAIMQTDFSKRQRNILDLVVRMSYGCQKKFAILRPSDFEVVGVYKTHIKKELEYLASAKVLHIDGERIAINKNYDEWRVSLVKQSNMDKLKEILKRNLAHADEEEIVTETVTEVTEIVTENDCSVTKTVTDSYQNSNRAVTKTVTPTLDEPRRGAGFRLPKDNIKDNIKTISSGGSGDINARAREGELFQAFENNFLISASGIQREKLISYLDDGMEPELILKAISITRENGKDLNYFWGILNRMLERGIKTLEAHEFYERKRRDDHAAYRNRLRGHHRENRDIEAASSGYYAGIGKRL